MFSQSPSIWWNLSSCWKPWAGSPPDSPGAQALSHSLLQLSSGGTTPGSLWWVCALHRRWWFEATVWDVAVHLYQGNGLGKQLMAYILEALDQMGTERVSLFADPGVVSFYQGQNRISSPRVIAAFWYAN